MNSKQIWVLIADAGRARLFKAQTRTGPLIEQKDWIDEEARARILNFTSDKQGRSYDSVGLGRHSMEPSVDPKKEEEIRFGKFICDQLYAFFHDQEPDRIYIVAPPSMLGLLRENLHKEIRDHIVQEVSKDLSKMDCDTILKHLPELL